jgi:anaerobic magnesium-protoporphyrin IX monomethyl ester cyclase
MKVLLLSLPAYIKHVMFPLGIGYLVGSIKKSHEVKAYHFHDMETARKEIFSIINSFHPHIIGLTCNSFNRGSVKEIIKISKDIDKNIIIIVGGVHASYCYDQMLTQYGADVVVIGEGENTFKELCDAIENNMPLGPIKGIAYKHNGKVILSPPPEPIRNIDDLPIPDYSYAQPFIQQLKMGFIITSRGCPVRCRFCSTSSYWGQRVRVYSPRRVVDEMEMIISRYQIKKIFFMDDTFNLGIKRVKEICTEIMDRKIKIEWGCECRVTPISEEMIAHMVQAGCRHISFGVESGSEEMLKKLGKKITLSQIRNAFEITAKFSSIMSTGALAMVGNPGESCKTINDSVSFFNSIPMTDPPATSILYILPGTLVYEDMKKDNHISDGWWLTNDYVPSYTLEHSFLTLCKWAKQVNKSGHIIPFDKTRHFWYGTWEYIWENKNYVIKKIIRNINKLLSNPKLLLYKINRILPA